MDSPVLKRTKTKPSHYSATAFHGVRFISAIASITVAGILAFFCIELKNEGYKIPWTFLIVMAASVINLLVLVLTLCIHCCMRLSPLFNLILNIPLLILWLGGTALLAWNIYGTLSHSCTISNWGNDEGVLICQEYKALFSFVVFGALAQIAMIVVDVRARMAQTRSGRYAKMRDSQEVKLEPYDSMHSHSNSVHDEPYVDNTNNTQYRDEPGWRPGQRTNTIASSSSRHTDYGDIAGTDGRQAVMMHDYHQPQVQQSGYDSSYGQHGIHEHRY